MQPVLLCIRARDHALTDPGPVMAFESRAPKRGPRRSISLDDGLVHVPSPGAPPLGRRTADSQIRRPALVAWAGAFRDRRCNLSRSRASWAAWRVPRLPWPCLRGTEPGITVAGDWTAALPTLAVWCPIGGRRARLALCFDPCHRARGRASPRAHGVATHKHSGERSSIHTIAALAYCRLRLPPCSPS